MNITQAAVLGVVEGLTEYLPVSSTGHLIITAALLGLDEDPQVKAAVDSFNIVIQGGAILAVLGLYLPRVISMLRGFVGRDAAGRRMLINLFVAFLPAAILGVLLDEAIGAALFHPLPVLAALLLGGIALLLLGPWQKRRFAEAAEADRRGEHEEHVVGGGPLEMEAMTWRHALIIGLMQCVAMWPGTSRSMMTIIGGMVVGLRPKDAAEFSFLLGLPTLGGACVYKLAKDLMSDEPSMFEVLGWQPIVVGIVTATISAALAVKWFVGYLGRHGLSVFGWYRIGLTIVFAALWLGGIVTFG